MKTADHTSTQLKIEALFDAIRTVLTHPNLNAPEQNRAIDPATYTAETVLAPIVTQCDHLETLQQISRHYESNLMAPRYHRYQMVTRFLNAIFASLKSEHLEDDEGIALLPTNPITIVHTDKITPLKRQALFQAAQTRCLQHQLTLVSAWTLSFTEQNQAMLSTTQPRLHFDLLQYLCREQDEHFTLNYAYFTPELEATTLSIDIATAGTLLKQCEIAIPYRQLITDRIHTLCEQANSIKDQKLSQFISNVLNSERDYSEKMSLISRFCASLANQQGETPFSASIEMAVKTYQGIVEALRASAPTPCTPRLELDSMPTVVAHPRDNCILPTFTLLTTLPEHSIAPNQTLQAFMLNQQLHFDGFIQTLANFSRALRKKHANAKSIAQPIIKDLLAVISSSCLTLEKKMLFDAAIAACTATNELITQLRRHATPQQHDDLLEHTITLNIAQTNALKNSGQIERAQQLSEKNLALLSEFSRLPAHKRYQMESSILGQQATLAFCRQDIESTETALERADQFIESVDKLVLPRLSAHYETIAFVLGTVQSRRLNTNLTVALLAVDSLLHGKRHDAYQRLCAAEKRLNACIPEDITRKIKHRFIRTMDLSINLSNPEQDCTTEFRRTIRSFLQDIKDDNFFECLKLCYAVEKQQPNGTLHYDLDDSIIKIHLDQKEYQSLTHALTTEGVPYKSTTVKKPKKGGIITLSKFAAINPNRLQCAFATLFKLPHEPSLPQLDTHVNMPNDPTLTCLRYHLINAVFKRHYANILEIRDRLADQQQQSPSHQVKSYCALLIGFANTQLARNALKTMGTSAAITFASLAQNQLDRLDQSGGYSKKVVLILTALIGEIDRTIAHTVTLETAEFHSAQLLELIESDSNHPEALYPHILSLYQDTLKPFRCHDSELASKRRELLVEMSCWLMSTAGKLYLASLSDQEGVEVATHRLTDLYQLVLGVHNGKFNTNHADAAIFFEMAHLLQNWKQLGHRQKRQTIESIPPKLVVQHNPLLSLRAKFWQFVLSMKLPLPGIKPYSAMLKSLSLIATIALSEHDGHDGITDLVKQLLHSYLLDACFVLLEKNITSLDEYAELVCLLNTLKKEHAEDDTRLCTLIELIANTHDSLVKLGHLKQQAIKTGHHHATDLIESLERTVLTLSKTCFIINQQAGQHNDCTEHHTHLHQCLNAVVMADNELRKLESVLTLDDKSTPLSQFASYINGVYEFIRQNILPHYLINGDVRRQNTLSLTPDNWYCAVKYQFFPKQNASFLLETVQRGHDVSKGVPLCEEDFALFLHTLDQHPDNAALNFIAARWYFNHDRNNSEGMVYLKKAAKQQHQLAEYYLGKVYRLGFFGKQPNQEKAIKHFQRSADQHHHYQSYYRLARHYLEAGEDELMKNAAVLAVQHCTLGEDVKKRLIERFALSRSDLQKKAPETTFRGHK